MAPGLPILYVQMAMIVRNAQIADQANPKSGLVFAMISILGVCCFAYSFWTWFYLLKGKINDQTLLDKIKEIT